MARLKKKVYYYSRTWGWEMLKETALLPPEQSEPPSIPLWFRAYRDRNGNGDGHGSVDWDKVLNHIIIEFAIFGFKFRISRSVLEPNGRKKSE